jgi:hypothetical protein
MDERGHPGTEFEGIQRMRDRASKLKELILNAQRPPTPALHDGVQPIREEGSATYVEIRPRNGIGINTH